MFKITKKYKSHLSKLLIFAIVLSLAGCGKAKSPLEKVMPYYADRVYNEIDLMPSNGKILTRARVELVDLTQQYYDEKDIMSADDTSTDEEKAEYIGKIMTMGWNLKVMMNKLSSYTDDDLKAYKKLKKDRNTLKFLKENDYNDKDGLDDYYFVIDYPVDKSMQNDYSQYFATNSNILMSNPLEETVDTSELSNAEESPEEEESTISRDSSVIETDLVEDVLSETASQNEIVIENEVIASSSDIEENTTEQTYHFIENDKSNTERNIHLDLIDDKYYELDFNLYKPVTITPEQFESLEVGDTIDLEMQQINKRFQNKTYSFEKTATNSFILKDMRVDENDEPVLDDDGKQIEDTYNFAFYENLAKTKYTLYFLRLDPYYMGENPEEGAYPIRVNYFVETRKFRVLKGAKASYTASQAFLAYSQYNDLNNSVYATIEDYYDNHYYGISNVASRQGEDIRKAYDTYQARNVFLEAIFGNRIFFNDKGYVTGMHFEEASQ